MQRLAKHIRRRGGFSLIELLAAIAIGAVIIAAVAGLTYNVAFHFDRGTRVVGNTEQLVLAVDRLASDIGSARYTQFDTNRGVVAGFSGTQSRIVLIAAARVASRQTADDVIDFTIENGDKLSRIIRRRAPWTGPRMPMDKIDFQDTVTLLEGPYQIAVEYGYFASEEKITWVEKWDGEKTMPRFIRLNVRDRVTKDDVMSEMTFALRADAPNICAASDSNPSCLTGVPVASGTPVGPTANRAANQPNSNPTGTAQ